MAFVCPENVQETTTTTGTGTVTLDGPVTGAYDFDSQLANADTTYYTLSDGTDIEVGIGTFSTTGPTLARTTILYSTNGGAAVDWGAGTRNVIAGLPGTAVSSLLDPSGGTGFLAETADNTYARRELTVERGLTITNPEGIAGDPLLGGYVKLITEFGALEGVGHAATNNTAFASAVTYLNSVTEPAAVLFPEGIWEYSTSPNWGAVAQHSQVLGRGVVRLRYTGTGNAFIIDGGAAGNGVFNLRFGPFHIEAPSTAGHGIYWRAAHHCIAEFNVRGCGTSSAALKMEWGVLNEIRLIASVNHGAFYSSGTPLYGVDLDERSGVDAAYNIFINPIIEGVGTGIKLTAASGNSFVGGAIEACTTLGVDCPLGSNHNKWFGTDFELNGGGLSLGDDFNIGGASNQLNAVDSDSHITILSGARFNKIIGCTTQNITVNSGASYNLISDTSYDRIGTTFIGALTDNGTSTLIRNIMKNGNGTTGPAVFPEIGRAVYTAELTSSTETVGASPWTYTNNTGYNVGMLIAGGLVTNLVYKRTAGASVTLGSIDGVFELSPGDGMQITYTVGFPPTVEIYPR